MPRASRLDGLRLAVGTFTIVRVRPPAEVTARTAGQAMLWAPAVGALLGFAAAAVLELVRFVSKHSGGGTLLAAAAAVTTLAVLTRALHLDGLADTADGLGSGKPAAEALDVMRRSDIGPFGVVTLVLTLLVQVLAIDTSVARGTGGLCVVVAVSTGGRSPALATYLRRKLTEEIGPEYETLLELLSEAREAMRSSGRSSEDADWQRAFDSGIVDLVRAGRVADAKELLNQCL